MKLIERDYVIREKFRFTFCDRAVYLKSNRGLLDFSALRMIRTIVIVYHLVRNRRYLQNSPQIQRYDLLIVLYYFEMENFIRPI